MNKYKKFMIMGISILIISIICSTGTYAWFTWANPDNTKLSMTIGNIETSFETSNEINTSSLAPVFYATEGEKTSFTISKTNTVSNVYYVIALEVETISNELRNSTFKWALMNKDTDTILASGDFADYYDGIFATLYSDSLYRNNNIAFDFYIYIDGNEENDPSMMNKEFKATLMIGGLTSIYGENIISPNTMTVFADSYRTSTFLNVENLDRDTIEIVNFIEITNDTEIPSNAVDISSLEDESIMLWYELNDNNLYNVTIGSTSGTIKLNTSAFLMFWNLTNLTTINGLNRVDTSEVRNMFAMFQYCNKLVSLDLSSFNTAKVENMGGMFTGCYILTELDLRSFDTSNVTNMGSMFGNCHSLTTLYLNTFDTSKVTNMAAMFAACYNLSTIDLSNFDTNNVKDMEMMFYVNNVSTIYVSDLWNTNNVTNSENMFYKCTNLVGAVSFNSSNIDKSMANYTTGYLTYKANTN